MLTHPVLIVEAVAHAGHVAAADARRTWSEGGYHA